MNEVHRKGIRVYYKIDYSRRTKKQMTGPNSLHLSDSLDIYDGRGGEIRTPDPLLPKRIQALVETC